LANSLRVLILDDNKDCADNLALLLGLWGHEAFVAYDGLHALELARIHRPDVAILDLAVHGMDGFTLAEHLRRQPESKDAVLIAITGPWEAESRQRSAVSGFTHHLLKPVDPDTLRDLLAVLLADSLKERRPKPKSTGKMPLPKRKATGKMPLPKKPEGGSSESTATP
jgi:CheY-like chemotaxis protein